MTTVPDISLPFTSRRIATEGSEILDDDGEIVGWTVDQVWGEIIVGLLNGADENGFRKFFGQHTYIPTDVAQTRSSQQARQHPATSDVGEPLFQET